MSVWVEHESEPFLSFSKVSNLFGFENFPFAQMNCIIPSQALKSFIKMLQCMSKFSDEMRIECLADKVDNVDSNCVDSDGVECDEYFADSLQYHDVAQKVL